MSRTVWGRLRRDALSAFDIEIVQRCPQSVLPRSPKIGIGTEILINPTPRATGGNNSFELRSNWYYFLQGNNTRSSRKFKIMKIYFKYFPPFLFIIIIRFFGCTLRIWSQFLAVEPINVCFFKAFLYLQHRLYLIAYDNRNQEENNLETQVLFCTRKGKMDRQVFECGRLRCDSHLIQVPCFVPRYQQSLYYRVAQATVWSRNINKLDQLNGRKQY